MLDILNTYGPMLAIGSYPKGPLGGLALTLILSLLGVGLAFPLSVLIALCRVSPFAVLRWPATAIVYFVRGVPALMLVFWSYFLVPVVTGHKISPFTTLVVSLVTYQAAYMAEVVRAGIQSLPSGQMEASRSLGMSYLKAMRLVLLPQALFNMLPSLLNQFISTVKETSIGYVISVQELTFAAGQVNASLLTQPFSVYLILSLTYFVVCFALTQVAKMLERSVLRRRTAPPVNIERATYDSVQASQ